MLCIAEQEQALTPVTDALKLFGRAQLRVHPPPRAQPHFCEAKVRLSNPHEGKKVKAFAKEKVWVLGSRVQSTLNGVHSTIARVRSSVYRTRSFAFAEQKHLERASNFHKAKVSPSRQLLMLRRSKEGILSVKVRLCSVAPKGG